MNATVMVPALFSAGADASGSLGAGWQAYDATTLEPKLPYLDVRVRNLTVTGTAVISSTTTSTGQFLSANGTAGAPAYSSTNDPNSGIFWNADDTMRFSLGGTERFRGTTTGMDFGALALFFGSAIGTSTVGLECPSAGVLEVTNGTTGQGRLLVTTGSGSSVALGLGDSAYGFWRNTTGGSAFIGVAFGGPGNTYWSFHFDDHAIQVGSGECFGWAAASTVTNQPSDTRVGRSAAAIVAFYGASTSVGSSLAIASDKQVRFSSTTDPDGTLGVRIGLDSSLGTGGLEVSTGAGGYTNVVGVVAKSFLTGDLYNATTGISVAYYNAGVLDFGAAVQLRWGASNPNASIDSIFARSAASVFGFYGSSLSNGSSATFASDKWIQFSSTTDPDGTGDVTVYRSVAGGIGIGTTGAAGGGFLCLLERTAPAAAETNGVRIYAEDNGAGKTRLMAIFQSGAAQQIAIEP